MLSDPDNRTVDVFEFGTGISLGQQISIRFDHIAALGGATRLEGGVAVLNFILEARHGRRGVGSGGVNRHSEETCQREYTRSEEHTSELQSHSDLVCRLLLDK